MADIAVGCSITLVIIHSVAVAVSGAPHQQNCCGGVPIFRVGFVCDPAWHYSATALWPAVSCYDGQIATGRHPAGKGCGRRV